MADTIRTLAAVLALLADNTSGDISPQDLRDAVVSAAVPHGRLSGTGNATATTIADTTSFNAVVVDSIALTHVSSILGTDDFDMPVAGQLRYIGTTSKEFMIEATISVTAVSNNQELHFRLAKNGTSDVTTEMRHKIGTGADVVALALHGLITLTTNDYITVVAKNTTTASNITVVNCGLLATGMMQ